MKKKRKKLILLISTFVLVILSVTLGSSKWNEKIEHSAVDAAKLLESEGITIRTIDTTKFEENPVEGNKIEQQTETNIADKNTSDPALKEEQGQTPTNNSETKPQSSVASISEENPSQEQMVSLEDMKQYYTLLFLNLESEISSKLNGILDEALADYQKKRSNNEDVNLRDFQTTYVTKIRQLEAYSDEQFNKLYKQFEEELAANDHSKNEATPYRAKYNAEKQNREKRAIDRFAKLNNQ